MDICAALLDHGATLKKNEFGMSPVIAAAERARELVVELFYWRPDLLTKEEVSLNCMRALLMHNFVLKIIHWVAGFFVCNSSKWKQLEFIKY